MSFYDDASLVVIPSGYKTSKVYAEKPTDGSGDLTFTRTGDTATRVNSAGIIEKVRTNLILQSQTFDNASWTKDGATVTANSTTAPDGTTTADKVLETATTAVHNVYQAPTLSSNVYSFSVFVKKAERFKCALADRNSGAYVAFNINTGVIIESLVFSGKIESYSNDWYRLTITTPSAYSVFNPQVFILPDSYTTGVPALITYAGSATSGLFVWAAQLEVSDFGATSYIPTTTAAVSVGPTANTARLDYLGSTCPRLLLEPQRSNLLFYSEQFNNAYWTSSASVTANTVNSPDGTQSADTVVFSSNNQLYNGTTRTSGNYCLSLFVKKGNNRYFSIQLETGALAYRAIYDLDTTTVTNTTANTTASITDFGGGWFRVSVMNTTADIILYTTFQAASSGTSITNGSGTFYLWGAQLEAGAYATSYIPTLAASATRGADACLKTGISSLIGQTEGTLYAEIVRTTSTATDGFWVGVNAGTVTDWIFFGIEATGARFYVRVNNVVVAEIYPTMGVGTHKMALGYKSGQIVGYIDGVQVFSSAGTFTLTSLTKFQIGATSPSTDTTLTTAAVKQALLFKTRLTNAELAELTTL